jgi:adenylosuccinate synthase
LRDKNQVLIKVFNRKGIEVKDVLAEYLGYAEILRPYVTDTVLLLDNALKANKSRIFLKVHKELFLDVFDHGTYPLVTSSIPTAGGASTGSAYRTYKEHHLDRYSEGVNNSCWIWSIPN